MRRDIAFDAKGTLLRGWHAVPDEVFVAAGVHHVLELLRAGQSRSGGPLPHRRGGRSADQIAPEWDDVPPGSDNLLMPR